ncbi:LysM peptidoglycan-binding domain-containing protein [Gaoshiqia sediminis]|uniref:LysM peptidoglycan-binding domain-containing protein n=1 Tax=Gaoshiqia sediminis TaxID=2986998 RepID=A0AA42C982_9BACT|nr:LysM peptidoglycan-binding domain-containing protein [Gaoshiqia sediminis]MCW0482162.1 LysM peptidoglycan-binding domain-containing protein [Gaoshiqia sediminis]
MKNSVLVAFFVLVLMVVAAAQTSNNLGFVMHQVKPGETIYSISKAFGIEQKELVNANPDLVLGLKAGQQLRIPSLQTNPTKAVYPQQQEELPSFVHYKVKRKNTLHYIARQFDVDVEDILKYNPEARTGINKGQVLRIPVKADLERIAAQQAEKALLEPEVPGEVLHRVVGNETLYSISKKYNCSIASILAMNPGAVNGLRIGMELKIQPEEGPQTTGAVASEDGYFWHRVVSGETFWGLEKKYDITKDELTELNPVLKNGLQSGLQIRIPMQKVPEIQVVPADESAFEKYEVGRGETLYSISRRFDVKIPELKRVNPVLNYRGLVAGETILVPKKKEKIQPDTEFMIKTPVSPADKTDYSIEVYVENTSSVCPPNPAARTGFYQVGLMLPLYLPANDTINRVRVSVEEMLADTSLLNQVKNVSELPVDSFYIRKDKQVYARSDNFLHFYEGVLLAVDSLQRAGMHVQLNVFDTNQSAAVIDSLIRLDIFRELDLIIGPVYPEQQKQVADFAFKNRIPMVSPLSAAGTFEQNNPYYFKVNPTKEYLIRKTADYIAEEYYDKNLIVLKMGEYKHLPEAELVSLCREKLFFSDFNNHSNRVLFHEYNFQEEGTWGLSRILSNDQENVFIIPSETEAQLSVAITNLNGIAEKYPVTLVGQSNFQRYKSIQTEYFHHTNLNFLSPYFVDYQSPVVNHFVSRFRRNFAAEPNQFSFQGYDVAFYFMSALFNYGENFIDCLFGFQPDLTQCVFSFDKVSRMGGYMNQGLFVTEYGRNYNVSMKGIIGKHAGYLSGE